MILTGVSDFLSWLRLSIYLAVIAMTIVLSFHLRMPTSAIERRMALPLGFIFWVMAVLSLFTGLGNYLKTVERYRVKQALVQSGCKTQIVSSKRIHASIRQQMCTYITAIDYLDSLVDYYRDLCFLHCTTISRVFLN